MTLLSVSIHPSHTKTDEEEKLRLLRRQRKEKLGPFVRSRKPGAI